MLVTALLLALGGLVQINPIWQWGPYEINRSTNGAQPDWYLGWLIGGLRLMPGFDVRVGGLTLVPNPFWAGALFPASCSASPRCTRSPSGASPATAPRHHLLGRPRDHPWRTAFGFAFLSWVALIFFAGSADRVFLALGFSYEGQVLVYRWLSSSRSSCSS